MNLKHVTQLGDIRLAYLLGCLEERTHQVRRQFPHHPGYIEYPLSEICRQLSCSATQGAYFLDYLEALGYLERKHLLDGPDQLRLKPQQ